MHLISDVLIYLRCHIFRCSTSFRSITYLYEVFKVHAENNKFLSFSMGLSGLEPPTSRLSGVRSNRLSYKPLSIWHPPALPYRLQYSTIGRLGLNHRVRDENGCVPQAHRHQKCSYFGFLHRRCALRITTSSLSFSDLPLANQQ